jgi:F-type H+-transporting ATPase subunit delta
MQISPIAERYAGALFGLAADLHQVEAVYSNATELQQICQENRSFVLMLKSPVINLTKKEKILRELFEKRFHEITIRFLLILVRKRREYLIPEIVTSLALLYKEYRHILPVQLTTAVPPGRDIHRRVEKILKDHTNWEIELTEQIDPGIIGGFILKWEDKQYDASIRHQLEKLRKSAAKVNLYKKGY